MDITTYMRIDGISNIYFKAQYINRASVKAFDKIEGKYTDKEVSFIEINPQIERDMVVLEDLGYSWRNGEYTDAIIELAEDMAAGYDYVYKDKIYALIDQSENFMEPNPDKILGLAHVSERGNNSIKLNFLQVKPSIVYRDWGKFKLVGHALSECLKGLYDSITLHSAAQKSVKEFYLRNGYIPEEEHQLVFHWKK